MAKKADELFTTDKRYPAEGKGLDYSTALPLDQQTGQEPARIPEPGRPTFAWGERAMRYRSTTNGDSRVK